MARVGPAIGILGLHTPIGSAPKSDRIVPPARAPGLAGRETAPGTGTPAPGADASNTAFQAQPFEQGNDLRPPRDHLGSIREGHSAYRAARATAKSAAVGRPADTVSGPKGSLDIEV